MIQFYKPTLKRKDMDSVLQTMVNDQIGPGKISRDFVQAFCDEVRATSGAAYRTATSAPSSALTLLSVRFSSQRTRLLRHLSRQRQA